MTKNFEDSQSINEKVSLENEMLIEEAKNLRKTNKKLNTEVKDLQSHIDEIKLDFTDFKSRYSNIHSRNLLEVFLIKELWIEVFNEDLTDEKVDNMVIATNKFKPGNVIVGQDYIGAISKQDAIDWIKIVKTALIFVENDNNELQEEMINYYKKKQKHEGNFHEKYHENQYNNYSDNYSDDSSKDSNDHYNNGSNHIDNEYNDYSDYEGTNQNISDDKHHKNPKKEYNNEDEDYDITNQFQNFWD